MLDKVNKKTLPSVQVSGVFQADAGFFDQSGNSKRTYDIGDGTSAISRTGPTSVVPDSEPKGR